MDDPREKLRILSQDISGTVSGETKAQIERNMRIEAAKKKISDKLQDGQELDHRQVASIIRNMINEE